MPDVHFERILKLMQSGLREPSNADDDFLLAAMAQCPTRGPMF
jgi:hypothetical protein